MSQKLVEQAKGKELGYRIIAVNKAGEGKPFNTEMVVLARTRWQLRRAVKLVMQTLSELKVEPHPDKTYIGRVSRGFCFLEYTIASAGIVGIAPQTGKRFVRR